MSITCTNDQLEDLPRLAGDNPDAILRAANFAIFCRQVQRSVRTDIILGAMPPQSFIRSLATQSPKLTFATSSVGGPANGEVKVPGVQYGSFYLFKLLADSEITGMAVFCDPPQTMPAGSTARIGAAIGDLKTVRSPLEHREAGASLAHAGGPVTGTWFDNQETWQFLFLGVPLDASHYSF
jgi:hypothetical protein